MELNNVHFLQEEYIGGGAPRREVVLINGPNQNDKLENHPRIRRLREDLADIWSFVTTFGRPFQGENIQAKQQERTNYYQKNSMVLLMALFEQRIAFCRERCILLHILWTQLGYPSVIISASNAANTARHTFLLVKNIKSTEDKYLIFDPENGIDAYESSDGLFAQGYILRGAQIYYQFNQDVQMICLASPTNHSEPVTFSFAGYSTTIS